MGYLPTLPETLSRTTQKYPDREAVVYPRKDVRLTYAEFDERVDRFANALRDRGVEPGDRVSLLLHNSAEFAVALFGLLRAGAVFNPINYRLAPSEVAYILDDSESTTLLFEAETRETVENGRDEFSTVEDYVYVDDDVEDAPEYAAGFHDLLENADAGAPSVTVEPTDQYAIMYTSGTTGRPKGVVHSHRDATYHNMLYAGQMGLDFTDVGISAMPLYHNAELNCGLLARINLGAKTVILHDFDPRRTLEVVDEERATHLFVASRIWRQLLETSRDLDSFDGASLELGVYGAAPMPPSLLEECIETFTEDYATAYGMTEMGPCATFILPFEVREHIESVGRAAPNHEVRIVEPTEDEDPNDPVGPEDTVETGETGEIILQGPPMMEEYWNAPEKTADAIRDGWFFTGDAGYLDEDGYLFLVDRIDDMIISGGENIYPTDVENVLYRHDGVVEVAVIGEDDEDWGERVVAYVVPDGELTANELDEFCRESDDLAAFKRPRGYEFRDELPRNPSGKIQKYRLREED
ncbi:long-chain-fatty-acid--CoA ligase [Natronolimnohabitans innermongolicus]|uniref:Long-chain-fatty-acid--CoA ligase n=1 Tax=Natronolimnohabitans innermongolicus JCM 12255 TaxID=1227499 RepID=L9WLM0_9EURY|nr:long-chain-fatty-acid--CoA ligase [Natronolimnohabitans innermongolicus]ELY50364.1 long-chain-fatty-acid--CoA ligase [Natronolimnohabitans innermongolicus JCM 12255]